MPFYDDAAADAALDAMWGANHGSTMPATFQVGLLTGDPRDGGIELTSAGGYARLTCTNGASFWGDAAGGTKTSVPVQLVNATGAYNDDADWWGIWVSGALFDFGRLTDTISVTAAGAPPAFTISVYFATIV